MSSRRRSSRANAGKSATSRNYAAHDHDRLSVKRRQLAEEAARIIADESVRDYQLAKKKASARLGLKGDEALPTNQEIESALNARLQLYSADKSNVRTREALETAIDAMEFLSAFEPRLSGSLVRGHITDNMPVELHLFAPTTEDVTMTLIEDDIPYELFDRRVRYGGNRYEQITGVRLQADAIAIEALIFGSRDIREAPLSPIDGNSMDRLDLKTARTRLKLLPGYTEVD